MEKLKNPKVVIGCILTAIMFATCAIVTGTMDTVPDWLPHFFDLLSIVSSACGIKVVVPTKREDADAGEKASFCEQRTIGETQKDIIQENTRHTV